MFLQRLPWRIQRRVKRALEPRSWSLSQAGQDAWVFGEVFDEKQGGYFLDIGAHDGITISNTYLLERRYRWTGLCVEANPTTFKELKKNRSSTLLNICIDRQRGEVEFAVRDVLGGIVDASLDNSAPAAGASVIKLKTVPLGEVLAEQCAPTVIDYLSIDVEGAEERVLDSFDFDRTGSTASRSNDLPASCAPSLTRKATCSSRRSGDSTASMCTQRTCTPTSRTCFVSSRSANL